MVNLRKKDFLKEILESKKNDKLTPNCEQMLILLANKFMKHPKFSYYKNPDDKKDVLQTGILILLTNWKGFDPEKGDPFSYFTEVAKRAFAKGFNDLYPKVDMLSIDSSNDGDGMYNF